MKIYLIIEMKKMLDSDTINQNNITQLCRKKTLASLAVRTGKACALKKASE